MVDRSIIELILNKSFKHVFIDSFNGHLEFEKCFLTVSMISVLGGKTLLVQFGCRCKLSDKKKSEHLFFCKLKASCRKQIHKLKFMGYHDHGCLGAHNVLL